MKMKGAKAVHYESGPNMTPLVDVVMVILIFLMLAGSFGGAEHFLASNVPMSKGGVGGDAGAVSIDEPVEIRVDSPSPDRFTARAGRITANDGATLTAALNKLRTDMNAAGKKTPDIQVKIAPARNVRVEHVVAVQEAAMRAQFEKIGFAKAH